MPAKRKDNMTPTNDTATPAKTLVKTRVFDLTSFGEVKVGKEIASVPPVISLEDAATRVGNDMAKLCAILTAGLQSEERRMARKDPTGWKSLNTDGTLGADFTGEPVSAGKIRTAITTFAKLLFGYGDFDKTQKDEKKKSKQAAKDFIKGNAQILERLKADAALSADDDDDDNDENDGE